MAQSKLLLWRWGSWFLESATISSVIEDSLAAGERVGTQGCVTALSLGHTWSLVTGCGEGLGPWQLTLGSTVCPLNHGFLMVILSQELMPFHRDTSTEAADQNPALPLSLFRCCARGHSACLPGSVIEVLSSG